MCLRPKGAPLPTRLCAVTRLLPNGRHQRSTSCGDDATFGSTVQDTLLNRIPDVEPLWEDAAASMGLPRNLEGVARLIRAAAAEVGISALLAVPFSCHHDSDVYAM